MRNSHLSGKYTIDRFEGNLAVLLFRSNERIELIAPRTSLPSQIKEGSIVQVDIEDGDIRSVFYLKEETETVRKRNDELLQELIKKNPFP